ncbi:MAG: hypothetical protein QM653_02870 [Dysgonomonas sp.]
METKQVKAYGKESVTQPLHKMTISQYVQSYRNNRNYHICNYW